MGPWESVIVAVASVLAVFVGIMAWRGFIEGLDHFEGHCATCGRTPRLPLPIDSHQCWRCHYATRPFIPHRTVRH